MIFTFTWIDCATITYKFWRGVYQGVQEGRNSVTPERNLTPEQQEVVARFAEGNEKKHLTTR
jgi:hypothetical protein